MRVFGNGRNSLRSVLKGLTWFTLELSLAVPQASAAHQVTVVGLPVPLLSDAIVVATVMAPL